MKKIAVIFALLVMCLAITMPVFANDYHEFTNEALKPRWPLRGSGPYYITGLDYYRTYTTENNPDGEHNGIDISADGEPVYPVYRGTVVIADHAGDAGYMVAIRHNADGREYISRYLHLQPDSITVSVDEEVTEDTVIGISGGSGASKSNDDYGKHLHLDIVRSGAYNSRDRGYSFDYFIGNPSSLRNVRFQGKWDATNGAYHSVYWGWIKANTVKVGGDYVFDIPGKAQISQVNSCDVVATDSFGIWYIRRDASLWQYFAGAHKKHLDDVAHIYAGDETSLVAIKTDGSVFDIGISSDTAGDDTPEVSLVPFNPSDDDFAFPYENQKTTPKKLANDIISVDGITCYVSFVLSSDNSLVIKNSDDSDCFHYFQPLADDVVSAEVCGNTVAYVDLDGELYIGEIRFDPVGMYVADFRQITGDVKFMKLPESYVDMTYTPLAVIKNDDSLWLSADMDNCKSDSTDGAGLMKVLDNVTSASLCYDYCVAVMADSYLYSFDFETVYTDGNDSRVVKEPEFTADLTRACEE